MAGGVMEEVPHSSYYLGFADAICWNIRQGNHRFQFPTEEVLMEGDFFPSYYDFCRVLRDLDDDGHIIYWHANLEEPYELWIEAYCTEDDEGVPGDFKDEDLQEAQRLDQEVRERRIKFLQNLVG